MDRISRFVIWICSKFDREQITRIVAELNDVLQNRNPEVLPKDDFKKKHPNYRNYFVDPTVPFTTAPKSEEQPALNWQELLATFERENGCPLAPIQHRRPALQVPPTTTCPRCQAPADYLYFNDGQKRSQVRCKVCDELFQLAKRHRPAAKYWCPYCQAPLFRWKQRELETIYKCPNDNCPAYQKAKQQLSPDEQKLQQQRLSQFKLHYQYREHHYTEAHLKHAAPSPARVDLHRIHQPPHLVGLILAFYVSFAIGARKTALMLRQLFGIKISHQTVLNYAEAAAFYCHRFNLAHKGTLAEHLSGDETYIKILGKNGYVFFFLSETRRQIVAYHIADSRGTLPATIAMQEAARTAAPEQALTYITDGNPAYPDALYFLNAQRRSGT